MVVGGRVVTRVALPGRPVGFAGQVREAGSRSVMAHLGDGRVDYCLRQQL